MSRLLARRSSSVIVTLLATSLAALLAAAPAAAEVAPHGGMLRYPDVSATHIVFVYANDLWRVPREGGLAVPLASPPGLEIFPRFSPDGQTIAFVGNYDGNRDLYTIPAIGGVPGRVTYHPSGEILCDWTPDGKLLFFTNGLAGQPRQTQLFTVGPEGGLPEQMPVPYGAFGAVSPDGEWLLYTPRTRDQRTWKRYRGGLATDLWLFNLKTKSSRRITDWEGTDTQPMWHGNTVYYLSDAGPAHRLNVWSLDPQSGKKRQVTTFRDADIRWPAIGPGPNGQGEIVFQKGTSLHLLDLGTEESRRVDVTIPGARPSLRRRALEVASFITSFGISPTGKRAVASARGDVWTVPAEKGSPRNLTRTSGVAERSPSWSPDGRWIAYFSDATGEYELFIRQSDGKGEPRQLTSGHETFFNGPTWSPDSKMIAFGDKAANLWLHTIETETTTKVDQDPHGGLIGGGSSLSWSHDSRFLAYDRTGDVALTNSIHIHEVESGESRRVTSDMFNDTRPVFDRIGDHLYYQSNRHFSPIYSDMDTSFVYTGSEVIVVVPLRDDQSSPFAPESDEEEWEEDGESGDEDEEADAATDENGESGDEEDGEDEEEVDDDGVSGFYEGSLSGHPDLPPGGVPFTMTLEISADGTVTGSVDVMGQGAEITSGTYDFDSGAINLTVVGDDTWTMTGTLENGSFKVTASAATQGITVTMEASRSMSLAEAEDSGKGAGKAREKVEIAWEGFEGRAVPLPISPGNFGLMDVNEKSQLIYTRNPPPGAQQPPTIKMFDITDEKREEKDVAAGAGLFAISADGKKMLVVRGNAATIQKAGSGAGKPVSTAGMTTHVDPREEWRQVLTEAWRLQRDFFYDPNMHGVDWDGVLTRYAAMLDDCVTREDVAFVIREMISELNVGHAYYRPGPEENQEPSRPVGMLGADYERANGAYRIAAVHEGAPWDSDARGPLSQPGVDVKVGDYLLAVNGVPVDGSRAPWAAFEGLAGRPIHITVSEKPVLDDAARDVLVEPMTSEMGLRYRAWIEGNRRYVEEKSGGKLGYIYVPDTGVTGQSDLFRQFFGQIHKAGLVIDERWNGGGQIPTRFIELLNRPVTNYWAQRDGKDLPWPPDAHHGPKVMLINGEAGSGGDAFPAYFRQAGLGKLVGTRTWGGLVGISGNPGLIDGARVTVPTFAYFEKDGTWGIEGHGVDPDIEVLDDPAKMQNGADPQLDAAIAQVLQEVERSGHEPPARPAYPDRSGMGIPKKDR